jgi:urease accessory protein UreH
MSPGSLTVKAALSSSKTALTQASSRLPVRIQPIRSSAIAGAGAQHLAWGVQGQRLRGGASVDLRVRAEEAASLLLTTQSALKFIPSDEQPTMGQNLTSTHEIEAGSLLVSAPDARHPAATGDFEQTLRYCLSPKGSLVAVDWVKLSGLPGAPSDMLGSFRSRSEVHMLGDGLSFGAKPVTSETLAFEHGGLKRLALDVELGAPCSHVASIIVAGPRTRAVASALRAVAADMPNAREHAGCLGEVKLSLRQETGRLRHALLARGQPASLQPSSRDSSISVGRILAENAEDVYRMLSHCLSPLQDQLGMRPYACRVYARATQLPPQPPTLTYSFKDLDAPLSIPSKQPEVEGSDIDDAPASTPASPWGTRPFIHKPGGPSLDPRA